jgi:hypothetical protein
MLSVLFLYWTCYCVGAPWFFFSEHRSSVRLGSLVWLGQERTKKALLFWAEPKLGWFRALLFPVSPLRDRKPRRDRRQPVARRSPISPSPRPTPRDLRLIQVAYLRLSWRSDPPLNPISRWCRRWRHGIEVVALICSRGISLDLGADYSNLQPRYFTRFGADYSNLQPRCIRLIT